MKRLAFLAALVLSAAPAWAGPIVGGYVEARTAEVFAGGCIMSSEAETIGRQAVMAWRIDRAATTARCWTACAWSLRSRATAISASARSAAKRRRTCGRWSTSTNGDRRAARRAGATGADAVARPHHRSRADHPGRHQLRRHRRDHRRGGWPVAADREEERRTRPGLRRHEVVHAVQRRGQPGARDDAGTRVHRPRSRRPLERAESEVGVLRGVQLRRRRAATSN